MATRPVRSKSSAARLFEVSIGKISLLRRCYLSPGICGLTARSRPSKHLLEDIRRQVLIADLIEDRAKPFIGQFAVHPVIALDGKVHAMELEELLCALNECKLCAFDVHFDK